MEIKIGKKLIGPHHPTFIIAEMSANHLKDKNRAVEIIREAKQVGADAIKLQTYTPDTITIDSENECFQINKDGLWDGKTLYELYQEAYTPWEWFPELQKIAEQEGIEFFSSPFDRTAVDFLEELDVPAYKVASFEITDIPLIEYIASKGKPVLISTGIAALCDIEDAVNACRSVGNNDIILLKCTIQYPAPIEEAHIRTIPNMADTFGVQAGLSDHTTGIAVPVAAVALGARVIEKHFTLKDRREEGPDAKFSLDQDEFRSMVVAVRDVEKALGKIDYSLNEKQRKNREFSRSLFVVKDISAGDHFTEENVRSIRPSFGLRPKYLEKVLEKTAKKDIKRGTPLDWDLIEP